MKGFLFSALLFAVSLCTFAQAQTPPAKTAAAPMLSVEVEGGKSLRLTAADLGKLARQEVRAKDHDGKESTYSGVFVRDILQLADAKLGKDLRGPQLANYLLVEAADGYRAVFAIAELDSAFTDKTVLLADTQDAKPLSERNGPWQMIVPDEKKHGRWVRQVTALRLKAAK